ncbi:MAG: hypothetical protein ABI579_07565 [Candidatus Sumerlaeota bacterium]
MIRNSSKRRGNLIFGLAGITLLLGVLCGLILTRSLEIYRDTTAMQQRLQCRAGAESLALLIERAADSSTLSLGANVITVGSRTTEKNHETVKLTSAILDRRGAEIIAIPYVAKFQVDDNGGRRLEGVRQP